MARRTSCTASRSTPSRSPYRRAGPCRRRRAQRRDAARYSLLSRWRCVAQRAADQTSRRVANPSRALIGTGFPFKRHDLLEEYVAPVRACHARNTAGIRRAGAAALDLSNVACGRFDAILGARRSLRGTSPPGVLLVREAGGIVTDLDGATTAGSSHGSVVAGNP